MMKRGGAEVAPAHLERVRRTPQWGGSGRCQAPLQGGRALPCLVKIFQHQRHAYCFQCNAAASIGPGTACTARQGQTVGCWMWYARHLAV